jgi:hypothetical protein
MRNGVSETELVAKATGERVTLQDVEAAIISEHYFTAFDGAMHGPAAVVPGSLKLLTICVLGMWNNFTITGTSACADSANFNEEIGRRLARTDAVNQIWPLMGYDLKSRMARDQRLIGGSPVTPHAGSTTYIGTKAVAAQPMTRLTYNIFRGWALPADENGADEGYLVEYLDRVENPPHVEGYQGYISWSPKEVFERAYRPVRQAERSEAATAEGAGTASVETTTEDTWQTRLLNEYSDLKAKFAGLHAMVNGPLIRTLPKFDRQDLRDQLVHMDGYLRALERRVGRLGSGEVQ